MTSHKEYTHNRFAPYWAVGLVVFGTIGLSTIWIDLGTFWKSYVLDIMGTAWNYILFRGLFTAYADNKWTRFFTPNRTLIIFLAVCTAIEGAQYLNLYDSTYDPWDFLSYVSLLFPIYLLDLFQLRYAKNNELANKQLEK